jgi:hypothetical protein
VPTIISTTDEIDKRYFVTSPGTSPSMFFGSTASLVFFRPDRPISQPPRAGGSQGWPRFTRPPQGLGLDWPEHGGMLRSDRGARRPCGGWCNWKYPMQSAIVVVRGRPRGEAWCIG